MTARSGATTLHLVRHAANDLVGKAIAGRQARVHLNAEGRRQAEQLARRLEREPIDAIFSSPLERARETAEPLARKLDLPVQVAHAFNEIDFGDWTGRSFAELEQLENWKQWNLFRTGTRAPGGELMSEVQNRMVNELEHLARAFPGKSVAIFSHADPLRAAIAYYLGMSIELLHRLEISPASVSTLTLYNWGAKLEGLNAH